MPCESIHCQSIFLGIVVASAFKEVAQAVRLALVYTTVGFPVKV